MIYYIYDVEVYSNYFLFRWEEIDINNPNNKLNNGSFMVDEIIDQSKELIKFIQNKTLVGFNNKSYDDVILETIVKSKNTFKDLTLELKKLSNNIIDSSGRRSFAKLPWGTDTIDLYTLNRLDKIYKGLKQIGSEMFCDIEELPIPHDKTLTEEEKKIIYDYCGNDIIITRKLFVKSIPELQLRYKAIEKYGLWKFVTSNDRPSLAMSILSKYYPEIDYPEDKTIPLLQVKDVLFDYIKFEDPINQKWLDKLKKEYLSKDFKSYITIGGCNCKVASGGLHSTMTNYKYISNDEFLIKDIDGASWYPNLMINNRIFPKHLDPDKFINTLQLITKDRLLAKSSGDKSTAEILKIVINSIYGQMGSEYSKLFDFKAMMTVTLNGQMLLLMLIEKLSKICQIIYANTDGISIRYKPENSDEIIEICEEFSKSINIPLEYADYNKMFIRDCNNYVVLAGDKIKSKGDYTSVSEDMSKGFPPNIIHKAAIDYLLFNIPIEQSIKEAHLKEFLEGQKIDRKFEVIGEFYDDTDNRLIEKKLQKINRYFVTNKNNRNTCRIYKFLGSVPSTHKALKISLKDNQLILCNKANDCIDILKRVWVDEKFYINEVKKLTSIFEKSDQLSLF